MSIKKLSSSLILLLIILVSVAISLQLHNYLFDSSITTNVSSEMNLDGGHFTLPGEFKPYVGTFIERNFPAMIISFFTLFGIFSKAIIDKTNSTDRPFWKIVGIPLLISPIVINPTFSMLASHPDGFVASLIAFQNGFFWQTLTETLRKK